MKWEERERERENEQDGGTGLLPDEDVTRGTLLSEAALPFKFSRKCVSWCPIVE
jgi:hypothetical protein